MREGGPGTVLLGGRKREIASVREARILEIQSPVFSFSSRKGCRIFKSKKGTPGCDVGRTLV